MLRTLTTDYSVCKYKFVVRTGFEPVRGDSLNPFKLIAVAFYEVASRVKLFYLNSV